MKTINLLESTLFITYICNVFHVLSKIAEDYGCVCEIVLSLKYIMHKNTGVKKRYSCVSG